MRCQRRSPPASRNRLAMNCCGKHGSTTRLRHVVRWSLSWQPPNLLQILCKIPGPKAQWLIDELQAPPLDKMLKEFLPLLDLKLLVNGKALIPSRLSKTLKRGIELKNMTVHRAAQVK